MKITKHFSVIFALVTISALYLNINDFTETKPWVPWQKMQNNLKYGLFTCAIVLVPIQRSSKTFWFFATEVHDLITYKIVALKQIQFLQHTKIWTSSLYLEIMKLLWNSSLNHHYEHKSTYLVSKGFPLIFQILVAW